MNGRQPNARTCAISNCPPVPTLWLASALAGFSLWVVLAELPRSGVCRLATSSDAAPIAATARARAAWAAAFGDVRGDLWAEAAFTYATLLSPGNKALTRLRSRTKPARSLPQRRSALHTHTIAPPAWHQGKRSRMDRMGNYTVSV